MIIGEIRRYLRDNNSIRVSRSTRDLAYKALSIREALTRKTGADPSISDITAALNAQNEAEENGDHPKKLTDAEVQDALEAIVEPISLYEPLFSDASGDSVCVMDQICDTSCGDERWLEDIALGQALSKLSDRERAIINLRFYKGRTQMEIADEIGISLSEMPLCAVTRDCNGSGSVFRRKAGGNKGDYDFTYGITSISITIR